MMKPTTQLTLYGNVHGTERFPGALSSREKEIERDKWARQGRHCGWGQSLPLGAELPREILPDWWTSLLVLSLVHLLYLGDRVPAAQTVCYVFIYSAIRPAQNRMKTGGFITSAKLKRKMNRTYVWQHGQKHWSKNSEVNHVCLELSSWTVRGNAG